MTILEELIRSSMDLYCNLAKASEDEKRFHTDIGLELQKYSYEMISMARNIREIKDRFGE